VSTSLRALLRPLDTGRFLLAVFFREAGLLAAFFLAEAFFFTTAFFLLAFFLATFFFATFCLATFFFATFFFATFFFATFFLVTFFLLTFFLLTRFLGDAFFFATLRLLAAPLRDAVFFAATFSCGHFLTPAGLRKGGDYTWLAGAWKPNFQGIFRGSAGPPQVPASGPCGANENRFMPKITLNYAELSGIGHNPPHATQQDKACRL
jgi:hypothetical protein